MNTQLNATNENDREEIIERLYGATINELNSRINDSIDLTTHYPLMNENGCCIGLACAETNDIYVFPYQRRALSDREWVVVDDDYAQTFEHFVEFRKEAVLEALEETLAELGDFVSTIRFAIRPDGSGFDVYNENEIGFSFAETRHMRDIPASSRTSAVMIALELMEG